MLPVLERLKQAYLLWHEYYCTLPKHHRYTLGEKIDSIFIDLIENATSAAYLPNTSKLPWVRSAIRKLDALKFMLLILWEAKSLRDGKYVLLASKLDEVGRMFGGWLGQLEKKNSAPPKRGEN